MKDLKIEYRDGKLIELVIDGERQDASTLSRISLTHEGGGVMQLQLGRNYFFTSGSRVVFRPNETEQIDK